MTPTVQVDSGTLAGRDKNGILLFAGIPYAAPPVGERRMRPPQPHHGWSGTRDATRFGKVAPQSARALGGVLAGAPPDWDEDCLFLNVQTPALDDGGRPVMVWIHGGAFLSGTGAIPWYDGTGMIRRGDVVVVSINYRLGALGWLELGHLEPTLRGSGNVGLLDQIAALEWVQRNIASFGGDPANVTVFGESAGARSVVALLGAPRARGLFKRAIPQSSPGHGVTTLDAAEHTTAALFESLGVTSVDEYLARPAADVVAGQDAIMNTLLDRPLRAGGGLPIGPLVDGVVLPQDPVEAVRAGGAADVALLTGTNRDEWNLFSLLDPREVDLALVEQRLEGVVSDPAAVAKAYAAAGRHPREAWNAIMTDHLFRLPTLELAEAHARHRPDHTFVYLFEWASPVFGGRLGSAHALEIPFVFDSLHKPGVEMMLGTDAPVALAEAMQRAWLAFARSDAPVHDGLPHWPPYDPARRHTMVFGDEVRVVADPQSAERLAWV